MMIVLTFQLGLAFTAGNELGYLHKFALLVLVARESPPTLHWLSSVS